MGGRWFFAQRHFDIRQNCFGQFSVALQLLMGAGQIIILFKFLRKSIGNHLELGTIRCHGSNHSHSILILCANSIVDYMLRSDLRSSILSNAVRCRTPIANHSICCHRRILYLIVQSHRHSDDCWWCVLHDRMPTSSSVERKFLQKMDEMRR